MSTPQAATADTLPASGRARWRERWAHLPRDTRDTLFLLGVIGLVVAPHLLHLATWCTAMVVAVLGWRARIALRGQALPSRWVVTALLLLASGLTLWREQTLLGKEAGITLLVVLMSLKTLELRARRDALVVFFLGFFLVLTHFLYSQSLGTGLWLLLAVWGLLTALTLAHMPVGRPSLWRASGLAGRAALLGLPVMLALFTLFPRIGPLWGLPQDAAGRTGLSGSMRLGGVASVAEDDAIAMRVRFLDAAAPRLDQMYFRGPVLTTFDGREWTRLVPNFPAEQRPRLNLRTRGAPLRYEMTLEPSRLPLLPMLEMTPDIPDAAPHVDERLVTLRPDGQWQLDQPLGQRVRLTAAAWLDHRHGPEQPVAGLRDFVTLPPNSNPRTLRWAAELRGRLGQQASATELSDAVLRHIRVAGFTYTLEPGPYDGHAIDEFWFDRKLGFCEHFASAYVVVMRAMDVPARVVTGYQGADPLPQDGYWIVRQRNAHAWAEYWQEGQGWIRADPTAAVAPDRIRQGLSLRPEPGLVAGAVQNLNPDLAENVKAWWEGVNNRWNQWVLNYSRQQQTDLLKRLGFSAPNWQDLASALILLLCSAALAGAAWAWWDRRRQDPWQRLQQRVARALLDLGVPVQPHHAPRARAGLVRQHLGPRGERLAEALEQLDRQRYGPAAADAARGPASRGHPQWWRGFAATARELAR